MEEIWKDIEGYEGIYQVSNSGKIKSLERFYEYIGKNQNSSYITKSKVPEKILNGSGNRYLKVALFKDGKKKYFSIHRLVAKTFIPNPLNLPCVNHKDENKLNNCVDNLEWCSYKYNANYGTRNSKICNKTSFKKGYKPQCCKKIEKCSLNGILLDTYQSIKEASIKNNLSRSNISKACKNKTKYKNYIWRYAD